jgi:GntR family transcriptional regulator
MPVQLDKGLPVPLYHQLKTVLLESLRKGDLKPNDQLPTEDELGAQFGVSKATVRQALRDLAQAGHVRRQQGRGTFVTEQRVQLSSFTEEMRQVGLDSGSKVLEQSVVPADAELARKLQIAEGAEVFRLKRLRLTGGEPMGVQTAYISCAVAPGLLEIDFSSASLYDTMEKRYGLVLEHAAQTHFALTVSEEDAGLLGVPAGSPALGGERLTFLQGGRPLEVTRSVMRGDRYQIQLKLVRSPAR